jgi:citronellol/citronellal dehydrogenase
LRAARDGAQVAILGKTALPHPTLPGTIHSAAAEVEAAGGRALALAVDVRDEGAVRDAVARAAAHFGGIDILVNNASAISLTTTAATTMKRFDLMMAVNVRATFLCAQACMPRLTKAGNAHILNLAPPVDLRPAWFQNHVAYTISKLGMSLCVLGMAEEFRASGIGVNALWPRTIIATSALSQIGDASLLQAARKPEIVADAAHAIFCRASRTCTGNFFLDEDVLRAEGVTDFDGYAVVPGTRSFIPDLFVDG